MAHLGSTNDQFTAAVIALGIDYVDYFPSRPVTQPFWRTVEATSTPAEAARVARTAINTGRFMPYNYFPSVAGQVGRHESDWEGVAIIFGSDNRPSTSTRHATVACRHPTATAERGRSTTGPTSA